MKIILAIEGGEKAASGSRGGSRALCSVHSRAPSARTFHYRKNFLNEGMARNKDPEMEI